MVLCGYEVPKFKGRIYRWVKYMFLCEKFKKSIDEGVDIVCKRKWIRQCYKV